MSSVGPIRRFFFLGLIGLVLIWLALKHSSNVGPVAVSFITDGRCITVVGVDRSAAICQFARSCSVVAHEDVQNCKRIFDAAQIAPSH